MALLSGSSSLLHSQRERERRSGVPRVVVLTSDGREVSSFDVPNPYQGNMLWRNMVGRIEAPLGWLGRAIDDARLVEDGVDPERLSERVMREMHGGDA